MPGDAASASLRRVVASTGHDLMQPLQVITATLERLSNLSLGDADRFWLDVANSETRRIAEGLHQLVRQSRQGSSTCTKSNFCLAKILDDVEADWTGPARTSGVRLTVVRRSLVIASEPVRLRSILDNLIGNAIKYSPSGRVLVGCRVDRGHARLEVLDNGCGIAADERDQVFSPYYQVDDTKSGLGLGLSLVREHCEELGHRIDLASEPGRGSRFTLALGRHGLLCSAP